MRKSGVCLFLFAVIQIGLETMSPCQTVMMVGDTYQPDLSSRLNYQSESSSFKQPTRPTTALEIFRYLFSRYPVAKSDDGPRYEIKCSWGGYIGIPYSLTESEALVRLQAYYNHPFPDLQPGEIGPLLDLLKPEAEKKTGGLSTVQPSKYNSGTPAYRVEVDVQSPAIPDPPAWGYATPYSTKQRRFNSDSNHPRPDSSDSLPAKTETAQPALRPETVVAMVHSPAIPFMKERLGTAWCLNAECNLLVTNYHVARYAGEKLSIMGERVVKSWMATGPDDADARPVQLSDEMYTLNPIRDIAILKLKKPLSHKGMHAVPFYVGKLEDSEPVTVYGYPNGKLTVTTGHFRSIRASGILEFDLDSTLAPGSSGGLIVNARNQAIGVLFALATDRRAAFAVPVWSLAQFVNNTDPKLYSELFANIPNHLTAAERMRATFDIR